MKTNQCMKFIGFTNIGIGAISATEMIKEAIQCYQGIGSTLELLGYLGIVGVSAGIAALIQLSKLDDEHFRKNHSDNC